MAEAYGTILIKAPDDVLSAILSDADSVSWDAMARLFSAAGISSMAASNSMLKVHEGNEFPTEGMEEEEGFARIEIFGDEWMDAMQPLVARGNGIEVYGSIFHEHGCKDYYALTATGERFVESVDLEGDDDEADEKAVIRRWLAVVPAFIQDSFPDVFANEEDESDEDDDEDEEDDY